MLGPKAQLSGEVISPAHKKPRQHAAHIIFESCVAGVADQAPLIRLSMEGVMGSQHLWLPPLSDLTCFMPFVVLSRRGIETGLDARSVSGGSARPTDRPSQAKNVTNLHKKGNGVTIALQQKRS
jgi:hypothetical protein